jgi:hypothetical protein
VSGRRLNHLNFKGPYFRSYQTAQLDTTQKLQWHAHCGTRVQLRNLRQKCRPILDSKDPEIKAMGQQLIAAVQEEPNPEFGALHLIAAALDASADTGTTWVEAMAYFLRKFQEMETNAKLPD